MLKTRIGEQIAGWTGRDVSLRGEPRDRLLPAERHAGRRARSAGRPAWTTPQIISMDRLTGTIRLLPLIIGRVEVDSFTMVRPLIRLVRDADGRRNWEFDSGAAALQLAFAGDVPLGEFRVEGGTVALRGPRTGDDRAARFRRSHRRMDERAQADRVEGSGIWRGEQVTFSGGAAAPFDYLNGSATPIEARVDVTERVEDIYSWPPAPRPASSSRSDRRKARAAPPENRHLLAAPDAGSFDRDRIAHALPVDREVDGIEPLRVAGLAGPRRGPCRRRRRNSPSGTSPAKASCSAAAPESNAQLRCPSASRTSRMQRPHHREGIDLNAADDERQTGGSCRSGGPSRGSAASSMPCGPPTSHIVQRDAQSGKNADFRVAAERNFASGPAGDLFADPRLQHVARKEDDEQREKRGHEKRGCSRRTRRDASFRSTFKPCASRARHPQSRAPGLAHPRAYGNASASEPAARRCPTARSGPPIRRRLRGCRSPPSPPRRSSGAGAKLPDYDALHAWSVADPGAFWDLVWDFCGVVGEKGARQSSRARRCARRGSFPTRG